jgi:UDP-N-acetylmuramoyl-tripeptide--D-alanyl-D-alanine ligase
LIVVGDDAALIADGALQAGMAPSEVVRVADRDEARQVLLGSARDGDTILVKASRGAQLDLLVEALVRAAGTGAAA